MTFSNDNPIWAAPDGYQQLESPVEGISVYALKPEESPLLPQEFHCPQCGAATRFNVAAGGINCEHCGYTAPPSAKVLGKFADEYEFTLASLKKAATGWGTARRSMKCDNCGAELSVDEKAITHTCSFCGSNKVNLYETKSDSLRPGALIPFKIDPKNTRSSAYQWLGKGWFHPKELGIMALIDRLDGIYLPFWTFDAQIKADWRAEVGYERQERYYDSSSKEWKTRTRIDWRWESGVVPLTIDDFTVTGNSHINQSILERIYPYEYSDLVEYNADFLAGWNAQNYDVELADAWETGKREMREQARKACLQDIPSPHVRNFSLSADFADESWRYVLLPVYLASYQYEQKVFQVMVNGQTGVVAGQKPVAWWKVWLAIAGILSPGMLLGVIGLLLLVVGGIGIIPLAIGGILLVIGLILSVNIYQQAFKSET